MDIKSDNQATGFIATLRNGFGALRLKRWFVISLVLVTVMASFAASVYYGAHLYRTYQAFTIRDLVKGAVKLNFQIPINYVNGILSEPRVVIIDMKNNDYQQLAYLRKMALEKKSTVIGEDIKDIKVPGKIRFISDDRSVKAKFSLTGQNFDHIADVNRWSLRIKIGGGKVFSGMRKFTLVIPESRSREPLYEWLNHQMEKKLGLISLRYEFVRVVFNGKDLGIYALEEHFDKRLIEHNGHREGLIVKVKQSGGLKIFSSKKVAKRPAMQEQWEYLQLLWESFRTGDIDTSSIFAIQELAQYYAMTDVVNGQHSHFVGNEFFYFNPITRLLQPIGREWSSPYKGAADFGLFIETLDAAASINAATPAQVTNFHAQVFSDVNFVAAYFQALKRISSPAFINDFLQAIMPEMERNRDILHSQYPYLAMKVDYLHAQTAYINSFLARDHSTSVLGYLDQPEQGKGILLVLNNAPFPIVLDAFTVGMQRTEFKRVVAANSKVSLNVAEVGQAYLTGKITLHFSVIGIKNGYAATVFPWTKEKASVDNRYPLKAGPTDYVTISEGKYQLSGSEGGLRLEKNLVVPVNYSLHVKAGTHIDLINGATILSYGPVFFEGSADQPVLLSSSDGSGGGLIVLNAPQQSQLRHAKFDGLSAYTSPGWSVSSGVLFFQSDVDISNSTFGNNDSEDALNIVRSTFTIKDSTFVNSKSDAFDADFSNGSIESTSFSDLGNDAIDISGSKIALNGINIIRASDKGLSIGESSVMTGVGINIEESGIAVTAKDDSKFNFSELRLVNNDVGFALYQKKAEYGPAQGQVGSLTELNSKKNHLIQKGSSLIIHDEVLNGDIKNVEDLMYGAVYGKATEKQR